MARPSWAASATPAHSFKRAATNRASAGVISANDDPRRMKTAPGAGVTMALWGTSANPLLGEVGDYGSLWAFTALNLKGLRDATLRVRE